MAAPSFFSHAFLALHPDASSCACLSCTVSKRAGLPQIIAFQIQSWVGFHLYSGDLCDAYVGDDAACDLAQNVVRSTSLSHRFLLRACANHLRYLMNGHQKFHHTLSQGVTLFLQIQAHVRVKLLLVRQIHQKHP